ncbi:MAG: CDGSH iron-sulfur domain-containing protein [Alphaproteobacteria bacterium]|nr:CDGSH iron-sulfur domain-containing protein [Alphaproteobacteria bacterium]
MAEPVRAKEGPYHVDLEGGRTYFWCACGRSRKQPFCDGSHTEAGMDPLMFTPEEAEDAAALCGCKATGDPPFCDHSQPWCNAH